MKKRVKKYIQVNIDAEFGSAFQKDFALQSIRALMDAWGGFLKSSHKNNSLDITIVEIDSTPPTKKKKVK